MGLSNHAVPGNIEDILVAFMARAKRNPYGLCNICGQHCRLTEDHVPPRGSIDPARLRIRTIAQNLQAPSKPIGVLSQNGLKFRSLCSTCNNERLGKGADPSLNLFSRKLAQILRVRDRIALPPRLDIPVNPQRIARAVVGHLLAADAREDMMQPLRTGKMLDVMRSYFLDETTDFPKELTLCWWTYAARRQVVLRGVGLLSGAGTTVGDFLKYFPVAFWLVHEPPDQMLRVLADKEFPVRGAALHATLQLTMRTGASDTFRPDWPERPDDNEALLVNEKVCLVADPTP